MGTRSQVVELRTRGSDDPTGERAAAVLAAYFKAEETRSFRRLLWRRLALCAIAAWLIEATTPLLPRAGLLIVLVACAVAGVGAAITEWRAHEALTAQLAQCPGAIARTVDGTF